MADNNDDKLKNLSDEEMNEIFKDTVEFDEKIANDWSVACSCLSSPWHYVAPVK